MYEDLKKQVSKQNLKGFAKIIFGTAALAFGIRGLMDGSYEMGGADIVSRTINLAEEEQAKTKEE